MSWDPANYQHQELTAVVLEVFYDVYNELGHGFLECVYEEAMTLALLEKQVAVERQHALPVWFRRHKIGEFKPDLVIAGIVIVELKAVRELEPFHEAQLLNYLRASDVEVGLLLNLDRSRRSSAWSSPTRRRKSAYLGMSCHAEQPSGREKESESIDLICGLSAGRPPPIDPTARAYTSRRRICCRR